MLIVILAVLAAAVFIFFKARKPKTETTVEEIKTAAGGASIGGAKEQKEMEAAGKIGEAVVSRFLRSVLKEGDHILCNISVVYGKQKAELDNVVVNENGVFIFEVKNYTGHITGKEEDREWVKTNTSSGGETYTKKIRNPLFQVKRQIYVLHHVLADAGVNVFVKGYVIFVRGNSPVHNRYVLSYKSEVDRVLHKSGKDQLKPEEIEKIIAILQEVQKQNVNTEKKG